MYINSLIRIAFVIAVVVSISLASNAQGTTFGIYMTTGSKNCPKKVTTITKKKICVMAQPVLALEDVAHISSIRYDFKNQPYFNITVTESGHSKLKSLAIAFPNQQIAVVVDDTLIGYLSDLDRLRGPYIRIGSSDGSLEDVQMIHQKLKLVRPVKD